MIHPHSIQIMVGQGANSSDMTMLIEDVTTFSDGNGLLSYDSFVPSTGVYNIDFHVYTIQVRDLTEGIYFVTLIGQQMKTIQLVVRR